MFMHAMPISAPASEPVGRVPGLVFGNIADAFKCVIVCNGATVLRGVMPADSFKACKTYPLSPPPS